jgi:two-component system response regulator AtoC
MTSAFVVIVLSADQGVRGLIRRSLESEGHEVHCVFSAAEAVALLDQSITPELLLLDVVADRCSEDLFDAALLERLDHCKVCVLAEIADTSWQRHTTKWNFHTVLRKPILRRDLENLFTQMDLPVTKPQTSPRNETMQVTGPHIEELEGNRFFFASSPAMMKIYKNIRLLAPVDIPILILGESGVGKEVVAMLLHKYHARSEKKFLNVNCAALPTELLESELFGYEAGAFTGAIKAKPGKFELAHKGTLLLDEIGEMSPQMQAKLLHVLQDGSFSRLGARNCTRVDVRVLAATNINMDAAIAGKSFREDLYYRLSAFAITIPPLRERREEIPFLMEQLLARGAAELAQQPICFTERVISAAQEYSWPGNLRELRNFVIRTLVLQDQETACNELKAKTRTASTAVTFYPPVNFVTETQLPQPHGMRGIVNGVKNQAESRMIQEALLASNWNRRRAASNLNISYRALLYKIQQHGLSA